MTSTIRGFSNYLEGGKCKINIRALHNPGFLVSEVVSIQFWFQFDISDKKLS